MIAQAVVTGLVATGVMDLWALAQRRLWDSPTLDYALVGRWLGHIPKGRLVHRAIALSPPVRAEAAIGWAAHYLTGIAFALAFAAILGEAWSPGRGPIAPLLFGAATVAVPFLTLQPGMGAGIAASRTPSPWKSRARSLAAHLAFGFGLWIGALLWMRAGTG